MLLKVTNRCSAGCSHCMESSTPAGQPMPWETFLAALAMTTRVEALAWRMGCPFKILLSGGECTEHPSIVQMVEEVVRQGLLPHLLTNGMWLADPDLRAALLRPEWPQLEVQVTHDARVYPSAPPPRIDDRRITYVPALTILLPLGRAAGAKTPSPIAKGIPSRQKPTSYNLRSLTRHYGSIEEAIAMLRCRALVGLSGHCTPSVSDSGEVVAGESRACWAFGTVHSSNEELTQGLLAMGSCNRCGLEDHLSQAEKRAVGLSRMYLGTEP